MRMTVVLVCTCADNIILLFFSQSSRTVRLKANNPKTYPNKITMRQVSDVTHERQKTSANFQFRSGNI